MEIKLSFDEISFFFHVYRATHCICVSAAEANTQEMQ